MKKIIIALVCCKMFLYASAMNGSSNNSQNNALNYYNDGVFDTISQINKEISEGISQEEIKNIVGKIVVLTPLKSISTVELIFYKTTGNRINLFNATTVLDENGVPYMLWDIREREVDANFIVSKLTERNIPVVTKVVGPKGKFYREPILIRDFVAKLKKSIKNNENNVAIIERNIITIPEKKEAKEEETKVKAIEKKEIPNKEITELKNNNKPTYNYTTFNENTKTASTFLRFEDSNLMYKTVEVKDGAKIGDFIVDRLEKREGNLYVRYLITYKEDDKKNKFVLYIHKKEVSSFVPNLPPQMDKKKMESTYICNFNTIKTAMDRSGENIKIDSSSPYYGKTIQLEVVKQIENSFLLTNNEGLPEIMLTDRHLKNERYCVKALKK